MSSATSTSSSTDIAGDSALRPWQFFLLAGMLCATAVVIVATGQSAASIVILSLTVVAASMVALGTYRALAPLVVPQIVLEGSTIAGRSRAGLEREKTLVLRTIKELEFDFAMGKIARADYDEMGGRLRARAIGLIRQLDAGDGYKGAIEQELQSRMAGSEGGTAAFAEASAKAEALAKEVPPSISAIATCASCGVTNEPDARFCKNCGTRLAV